MNSKKIVVLVLVIVASAFGIFTIKHTDKINNENSSENKVRVEEKQQTETKVVDKRSIAATGKESKAEKANSKKEANLIKNTNLYNELPSSTMPLSVIAEISYLPENIQDKVSKIAETNNIYMVQKNRDKLIIITDNPENIRHSVEFTEITISNGHQTKTTLGYNDRMNDANNDIWEYNQETKQPTKHTKYNSDGDLEFVETWIYDPQNPIKYEMKDANGKVISMRKETLQGGTDLRVEHLLYDKEGNTRMNVSATYEGEDIKRFTYYNADKPNESGSIFSDYSDGQKTKETVYTSDLKVKNTYTSEYKDGNREEIVKWNNNNEEVQKYLPKEN